MTPEQQPPVNNGHCFCVIVHRFDCNCKFNFYNLIKSFQKEKKIKQFSNRLLDLKDGVNQVLRVIRTKVQS
jgi:hypothetical protein